MKGTTLIKILIIAGIFFSIFTTGCLNNSENSTVSTKSDTIFVYHKDTVYSKDTLISIIKDTMFIEPKNGLAFNKKLEFNTFDVFYRSYKYQINNFKLTDYGKKYYLKPDTNIIGVYYGQSGYDSIYYYRVRDSIKAFIAYLSLEKDVGCERDGFQGDTINIIATGNILGTETRCFELDEPNTISNVDLGFDPKSGFQIFNFRGMLAHITIYYN